MNCNKLLLLLSALLVVVLALLINKSKFIGNILNDNYTTNGCIHENRQIPEGRVPGSWLNLNNAERRQILENYVTNNPNLT